MEIMLSPPLERCSRQGHAVETHLYIAVNFYAFPGLWAVLNTACLCCRGRLESQDSSHWDAMLKYNVIGTLRTARTFMPLLKNKSGKAKLRKPLLPPRNRSKHQDWVSMTELEFKCEEMGH
jgi:NAD(P)-dependent dehydrogenase (short-subunit alcohol dehydrogenase family)